METVGRAGGARCQDRFAAFADSRVLEFFDAVAATKGDRSLRVGIGNDYSSGIAASGSILPFVISKDGEVRITKID